MVQGREHEKAVEWCHDVSQKLIFDMDVLYNKEVRHEVGQPKENLQLNVILILCDSSLMVL